VPPNFITIGDKFFAIAISKKKERIIAC